MIEKRNDIIIRYTVYGFLTGILFPFFSLLLHSLAGKVGFNIQGFAALHSLFSGQYLLDFLPLLGGAAGGYHGWSIASQQQKTESLIQKEQLRSEKILAFVRKLISNEQDASLDLENPADSLAKALIDLRNNLKKNNAEQLERKQEDDQRHWVSEGLAKFGDILRGSFDNMEEFSYNIISYLVKYLQANQGGLFIREQEEENQAYFEMKACYAYDRRKFADKRIELGEGLIGTCALEKKSIHMTDIPDGYLDITSGLGMATPETLLIVPMLVQEEVLGIIELASFNALRDFEVQFVESIAENTAITISNLRSSIRTASLLKESQQQAEAMARQEEKMRESMKQLRDTQEQAARQAEQFISFTNSVNHTLIRAEYATDGTLLYANTKFLHKLGYFSNAEVEGQHISKFIDPKDRDWFDPIWHRLAEGGKHYEGYMKHLTKSEQDLWTMATYTCVRKDDGSVDKILFLAIDNTEQHKQSLDYEGQIASIDRLNIKAEFAPDGKFIHANDLFLQTFKYTGNELEKMTVFDLIEKPELESFNEIWQGITAGNTHQGQMKSQTKYEDEVWFRVSYTAVNDLYGEVAKVIFLAMDISQEKMMELESRKFTEQLKLQEEQLKLSGVELKKKLEHSRKELENQYNDIVGEYERLTATLNHAADIILTIDAPGRIRYLNRTAETFWKARPGRLIGKPLHSLLPEDREESVNLLIGLLQSGIPESQRKPMMVDLPGADGTLHKAHMRLSQVKSGNESFFTGFFTLQ